MDPSHNHDEHYNRNGESYWLMGEALGSAMAELLKK